MPMSEAKEQNNKRPKGKGTEPTQSFDGSTLGPGGQIGPFRIEQELGRGGAGVVYLAHDTKLDRPVAIKSLPAELIENPKARTRFTREARVLASLNHPNIGTIYEELEEAEGVGYLVLEYVPGQTLAERIAGARLKPQEALSIAQQIAEAVAAAHEHDVIHRDLKPGNIKITPEGKVKVLDFGLAKALGGQAQDQQSTVTEPGRIIGTPAYMSPEQARGQPTDKRCDIWSFGCVLYEMLTGKVPFKGQTVSDTLAAILDREPDWHALPQATPANIQILLRRCLEKDQHRRLQHIGDASIEISETMSGTLEVFALPDRVAQVSRLSKRNTILACLVCLITGILIAGVVIMNLIRPSPTEPPIVSRHSFLIPPDKPLNTGGQPQSFLAISPDGTRLVYVGKFDDTDTGLYLRSMDDLQVKPIPGTRDAHNPFFSPDGQWVGFFTNEEKRLKKVSLTGGEPLPLLGDISWSVCTFGSWADDGTIVFSSLSGEGLIRISEDGGRPITLIAPTPEQSNLNYRYPQVLPGGNAILYSNVSSWRNPRTPCIEAFLPETGRRHTVLENASYAKYVRSGHLIFLRDNVLMAAPLDVRQLKITGPYAVIVDDVGFDWRGRTPQIAISHNGTFVYISGSELRDSELVWVDRQGASVSLGAPAGVYQSPRLSPDEQRVAVSVRSQKEFTSQIYIYNIERGTLNQFTTDGENDDPQWSPDGMRIAFSSRRSELASVLCKAVSTSAPAELLVSQLSPRVSLSPYSWSHNKNFLACTLQDSYTHGDIWIVEIDGDREPKPFLCTEYSEYNPTFSPDGRWLAYVSEKSGQPEVYLREYTEGGLKERVSTDGGGNPVWSRDGRELYYVNGKKMMVVKVTLEPDFNCGTPEQLFEWPDVIPSGGNLWTNYDVSDDGQFLMIKRSDDVKVQLICVHNWFEELKRLAPTGKKQ